MIYNLINKISGEKFSIYGLGVSDEGSDTDLM